MKQILHLFAAFILITATAACGNTANQSEKVIIEHKPGFDSAWRERQLERTRTESLKLQREFHSQ